MATTPSVSEIDYPSSDGRPLAETPIHRKNLLSLIDILERRYADDPWVYVSGNMMMYYVPGDKRRHVSPDVFLARGVSRDKPRDYYLVWEEHAPDLVIEITSASTRDEDLVGKMSLYQDVLHVREYFLFDPHAEYLDPPLQGFRLDPAGKYALIQPIEGRLPSEVTGLDFEVDGEFLRPLDPVAGHWLLPSHELLEAAEAAREQERVLRLRADQQRAQAEKQRIRAEEERARAEEERVRAAAELTESSAENDRLRRELEALRRQLGDRAS